MKIRLRWGEGDYWSVYAYPLATDRLEAIRQPPSPCTNQVQGFALHPCGAVPSPSHRSLSITARIGIRLAVGSMFTRGFSRPHAKDDFL